MAKVSFLLATSAICVGIYALITSPFTSALPDNSPHSLSSLDPPAGAWDPCGDFQYRGHSLCVCHGSIADCSDNWDDFMQQRDGAYIPTFSRPIETLLLSSVYLRTLPEDFFRNVTNITHLDLRKNSISEVSQFEVFEPLHRLKVLDFSENHLEFYDMGPFLSLHTLEQLDLSGTLKDRPFKGVGPVPEDLFRIYPLPRLTTLFLDFCDLENLQMYAFQPLEELRELSASSSHITYVRGDLPNLQKLNVSYNLLPYAFDPCDGENDTTFPSLTSLDLSGNRLTQFWPPDEFFTCNNLPRDARFPRRVYSIETNLRSAYFARQRFPALQNLFLKDIGSTVSKTLHEVIFFNDNVQTMDLRDSLLDFASYRIDSYVFAHCTNVKDLNLEGNTFRGISEQKFSVMFLYSMSLRFLNLASTQLDVISREMVAPLMSVTKLYLNDNILTSVPDGVFDDLDHLNILRLDGNLISTIGEDTFSLETIRRLTSLNLSNNPFECTCSLLWFRNYLRSNPGLFDAHNPYSRYRCKNLPDADVATFFLIEQQCLFSHETYVFTVVCVAVIIVTFTASTLLYRYRWHIRFTMYDVFRGNPQARWKMRRPDVFQYDLFVSYSGEDVRWVIDHLIPVLEQQMGLRLCVHQRDFLPGNNITDNIIDSLAVSKRVLALFTPRFAESHWCDFELQMCLNHVIENDDVMVVVILEHVPARDMTGVMLALMKTTTYIEWGKEEDAVESFWRRMTLALADVLPGCRQ